MIPSSGSKIFVIAGAGNSTELIVDELLKHREEDKSIEVRVLTRKESSPKPKEDSWARAGARFYPVVYNPAPQPPHESLISALTGAQVIISGIGIKDPFIQVPLAKAALQVSAPNSVFFPFEFGAAADPVGDKKITRGVYLNKRAFRDWLEGEGGWSGRWIALHTGWYAEVILGDFIGFNVFTQNRDPVITIYGDGNSPISWTTRPDIARFIAHVAVFTAQRELVGLASRSPRRHNALRIEGTRITSNDLLTLVLDVRKQTLSDQRKNVEIHCISSEELRKMWEKDVEGKDFVIDMLAVYDQGFGVVGPVEGGNWRDWWPEWNPTTMDEVVRRKFQTLNM